jgi:hypothetical protein
VGAPGNHSGWNYSGLEINLTNVGNLSMALESAPGILDAHEASPFVIGDTMYIVTPKQLRLRTISKDGVIKWEFRPKSRNWMPRSKPPAAAPQTRSLAQRQIFTARWTDRLRAECRYWESRLAALRTPILQSAKR